MTEHPRKTAIYVLVDPRTFQIRYVGKTINPSSRLRSHCARHMTRHAACDTWVRELRSASLRPLMRVVSWTDAWEAEERALIAKCRASGRTLLNIEDGGLIAKTSQKRLSAAFVTYRKIMASLSRCAGEAEARGDISLALRRKSQIKTIRAKVRASEARGQDHLDSFYNKVHQRFGYGWLQ